jgi:hypothetical protein
MTVVRFGLVLPAEIRDPRHLDTYLAGVERAPRLAAGH